MRPAILACALAACGSAPLQPQPVTSRAEAAQPAERWVAIALDAYAVPGSLVLARIDHDKLVTVADPIPGGMFGWLDARTLYVVANVTHGIQVTSYVDGKRVEQSTITDQEWPHQDFVELVLTHGNEAWISKCVLHGNECGDERIYRRLVPASSTDVNVAPRDVDTGRVDDRDDNPWPLPPTSQAPAGVTLALGKVDVEVTDPYSNPSTTRHDQVNGVICETRGARATYPKTEWDTMMGPDASTRSVRWVSSSPPLFEISDDSTNPAGYDHVGRMYARPCEPPFDGYAWLGDDLWASFMQDAHSPPNGTGPGEPPLLDGDWTFHRGDKVIGKVHGIARLRANVLR